MKRSLAISRIVRDFPLSDVLRVGLTKNRSKTMKSMKNTARLFLALAVVTAPAVSFSAEDKKMDALMEPVKSVLDHYLAIQKDLAKDSIKGVDEHANAIAKAIKSDDMKMLSPDVAAQ